MKRFIDYIIEAAMSHADALKTLGLKPNFTDDQLKTAYKQAAIVNHPDKGGSVTSMQQINVARDVLAQTPKTVVAPKNDDDEHETYEYGEPYPQRRTITKADAFALFKKYLNAEVRHVSVDMPSIRIPFKNVQRDGKQLILLLRRQTTMIGVAYFAVGIYENYLGKLKKIQSLEDSKEKLFVWESHNSLAWFINELQPIMSDSTITSQKIKAVFKKYLQSMTKIDKNVQ